MTIHKTYFNQISRAYKRGDATEHTHRPAIKEFIESFESSITATNEPKRVACGAPDFVISRGDIPVGYIETKDLGISLDNIEASEQLSRYRDSLHNLILTNYLDFRWYESGERRMTATIGHIDINNKLIISNDYANLHDLLSMFLNNSVPTIDSPKDLAFRLASIAKIISSTIVNAYHEEDNSGNFHTQLQAFQSVLVKNLTVDSFADMYAQTIAYGLFTASINLTDPTQLTRQHAAFDLPPTNPFLRTMFSTLAGPNMDERIAWAVDDLVQVLRRSDIKAVMEGFGQKTRREDPVLHFYETFLTAYNPEERELRGVYYTPEPVVSFIVRSVDNILKSDFDIANGISDSTRINVPVTRISSRLDTDRIDSIENKGGHVEVRENVYYVTEKEEHHKVIILDPAVGTGTFLRATFDHVHQSFVNIEGAWSDYVEKHLLPRIYGFELLMAPYAISHMKLGLFLKESGYNFKGDERLHVYLTNSLEEASLKTNTSFAADITKEANEARQIKRHNPVMVIMGNPPYSGHSANTGDWIQRLMRGHDTLFNENTHNYFSVDGKPLRERNPKWINNDYVKFIRFAQWRIERTGSGVLAFITDNSYLDSPTFRGMRDSLMQTFDKVYLYNLHGNSKKKERSPDGSKDENVFDITQGVSIGIFVKLPEKQKTASVYYADLWGSREVWQKDDDERKLIGGKYHELSLSSVNTVEWTTLAPTSPDYLFVPQNLSLKHEYEKGWRLTDIFKKYSVGIVTARDKLTIHFTKEELLKTLKEFASLPVEEARTKFKLGKDARDWKVHLAQKDLRDHGIDESRVVRIQYRPFDMRYTYYTGRSRGFHCMPRKKIMDNMLYNDNTALYACRQIVSSTWDHVISTKTLMDDCGVSTLTKERGYLFPFFIISRETKQSELDMIDVATIPNLSKEFINYWFLHTGIKIETHTEVTNEKKYSICNLMGYFYAIMNSLNYRLRYYEELSRDYPRIPITSNKELIEDLSNLGLKLLYLQDGDDDIDMTVEYKIHGNNEIKYVKLSKDESKNTNIIHINDNQYFSNIPDEVWSFKIGSYYVCRKWLESRRGIALSFEDIQHFRYMVAAIKRTIELQAEIDELIESHGGWPIS